MANADQSIIETSFNRWKNTLLQTNPGARGSLILRLLDRFGIKNADDLIYFLNSPEGKTLEADIANEIARLIAEKDAQIQAYQQEEIRQERFLGYLLIAEMEREAAQRSQQSIDTMAQLAKSQKSMSEQSRAERVKDYETLLEHYTKAESGFMKKLATQETSLESVNNNIKQLESARSMLQKVTDALSNLSLEEIEEKINQLNNEPLSLEEKLSKLRDLQDTEATDEDDQLLADEFLDYIRAPDLIKNERASRWLAQELKEQQAHDAFLSQNGFKKAYSVNAEPLTSLASAAYIVPNQFEIAKKDDRLYLIPAGESINHLSPSELDAAEKDFKNHEPEMRTANQYRNTFNELLSHTSQALLEAKAFKTQLYRDIHETKESINELQKVKTSIQQHIKKTRGEPLESQKEADDNLIPADLRSLLKLAPTPSPAIRRMTSTPRTPSPQMIRIATLEDTISGILRQRETRRQFLQDLMHNGMDRESPSSIRSPFDITPGFFKP